MKTTFTTFVFSLALCAAVGAAAQPRRAGVEAKADTVMLSEKADGDYIVRRALVERKADSDYSVRYLINLATLDAALGGNSRELSELNSFVSGIMKDSLSKINSVVITGYASPDGPVALNERLARNRARDFRNYVDTKYGFSKKFDVKTSSVAEDWEMCRALVEKSSMPEKQAVLRIIDGSQSSEAKEAALKQMPAVWEYMAEHILPPIRRVAMTINYDESSLVEQRTRIRKPKPAPKPAPQPVAEPCPPAEPCRCWEIGEEINGIIVEIPDAETSAYSGNARGVRKAARRDVRNGREVAAYDSREAERIDRQAAKAEKKIAKKEAKAAKKA
ncbi:MAG: hypothetical protein K2N02_03810, partial [Alistipes sp.]|nr:hypothetical protein [Alistipes sp.]